jgi:hypothetical protein
MKTSVLSVLVLGVFGMALSAQDATRGAALYNLIYARQQAFCRS